MSIRITYYLPTDQQSNAVRYMSGRPGQEKSKFTDLSASWEILARAVHMDSTIRTQRTTRRKKDVLPQGLCRLVIWYWKELKFTDVWINVSTGLTVSIERIFQLQIHHRPLWSLWVHKEKWKEQLTLSSHSYSWRRGKLTRLGHMTRSLQVGFILHHFRHL